VTLITQQLKHVSTRDFDKIKCSSSGNSKFVVTNCYMLFFVLYKTIEVVGTEKLSCIPVKTTEYTVVMLAHITLK